MAENQPLPLERRKTAAYRVVSSIVKVLSFVMFRPRVTGAEAIPAEGPVLIAPIHRSNIDFVFTLFLSRRKCFFMAKDSLFRIPVIRQVFMAMGAFPVKRGTADRESLALAEACLQEGLPLVLFPEGTRREGFHVTELHDGAAFVAARTGAVIVPVGIGGSERAMPKGSKMIRPTRITVVVGTPVQPPVTQGRIPRSVVAAKSEELRLNLEAAYHASLSAN